MSTSFDLFTNGCSPGNSTCNYEPGSVNFFEGEVEYVHYGYNVQLYSAAIFVAFFALTTGESLLVPSLNLERKPGSDGLALFLFSPTCLVLAPPRP
jgi:hypothetical protein